MRNIFLHGQKPAAFAVAAVTVLSAVPASSVSAAGDIGAITFKNVYDGTGEYKYRIYVDGEDAFCLQPGAPLTIPSFLSGSKDGISAGCMGK